METSYNPASWANFFMMMGTAASALVGLLFIVMVLHIDTGKEKPGSDMAVTVHGARNNTYHLLSIMVISALVLIPQPPAWLGAELVVINLFGLRLPAGFTRRWLGKPINVADRQGFPYDVIVAVTLAYGLGVAGGVALLAGADWGMYLASAGCLLLILRTVLTARELLFGG